MNASDAVRAAAALTSLENSAMNAARAPIQQSGRPSSQSEKTAMTEPCDLTARAARRLIGAKKLAPTELLESCIGRIEAVDHAVNAIVARDFARARKAATAANEAVAHGDALPLLHGLPLAVKDLEPTAGLRTAWGSPLFRDHVPDV